MELFRALGVMADPPGPETALLVRTLGIEPTPSPEDYTELFILHHIKGFILKRHRLHITFYGFDGAVLFL